MHTDPLKNTLQSFLTWRASKPHRVVVKTRYAMLRHCCIGQTNRNGKILVHKTDDFSAVLWDSAKDARDNTGYYADDFQCDVICWQVVKIAPANRKSGREALFVPVTYCTGWMGVIIHVDHAGSMDDAKRWGESIADDAAEESREYQRVYDAKNQIGELRDDIAHVRNNIRALFSELRQASLPPAICDTVREKISKSRNDVHRMAREIRELRAEFNI